MMPILAARELRGIRTILKHLSWRALLLTVVVIGLIGGAVAIERITIARLLHDDAASTATTWTEFLAANTTDIAAIIDGKPASQQTMDFVAKVKTVARVFLYKIYDAHGSPRFISDDLTESESDEEDLALHNPEAAEAIEHGAPEVELKEGQPPSRPLFYSEAYVPLVDKSGKVTGVVEAYIDQTAKRAEFERTSLFATLTLLFLIAAAFGIPGVAWYFRKRAQERSEEHVRYLAHFDALSGLANRASLTEGLDMAMRQAATSDAMLAVHCIDIDRFKDINDRLGLDAGDLMIKVTAERLRALAGADDIVGRLAGNEFALVQRSPRDQADVESLAGKIAQRMAAPETIKGEEIAMSVSVGVALAPEHGKTAERLVKSAELALARSKSEGRGHVNVFTPSLDKEMMARLRLERAIANALATGGFSLHFQPLRAEPRESLTGFEALTRLQEEDGTFIPPTEFILAAERMGVIGELGAWVLEEACHTAAAWPEELAISVNLSSAQFGKGTIIDVVAAALANSGLQPQRLLLEITESLLLGDSEMVMAELRGLKALGAQIVMDDFGTGYSSLSYLWRFPFDKIKVDGSFMRALEKRGSAADKIVRTIIALGHALGMRVCVEGVETAAHADFARTIGCDEVQGYHFGYPMPATDVAGVILADFRQEIRFAAAATVKARRA